MCVKNFKSPYGEIIVEDDNESVRLEIMYESYQKIFHDEEKIIAFLIDEGYLYKESKIFMGDRDVVNYYYEEYDEELEQTISRKQTYPIGPIKWKAVYYFKLR